MATGLSAGLTAAEGRKFGLTVGTAFLVFAAISYLRGHQVAPTVLGALGAAFWLGGLVVPSNLGPVRAAWLGLGHAISKVTTPIFMGVLYFVVLTPTGIMRRLLGGNALVRAPKDGTYWVRREASSSGPRSMQRQF